MINILCGSFVHCCFCICQLCAQKNVQCEGYGFEFCVREVYLWLKMKVTRNECSYVMLNSQFVQDRDCNDWNLQYVWLTWQVRHTLGPRFCVWLGFLSCVISGYLLARIVPACLIACLAIFSVQLNLAPLALPPMPLALVCFLRFPIINPHFE